MTRDIPTYREYSGTIVHAILQQAPQDMRRSIINAENEVVMKSDGKFKNDVVFLFTGQGSQYAGMGKELYNDNEAFGEAMDQCEGIYKALAEGESLLHIISNTEPPFPFVPPCATWSSLASARAWQAGSIEWAPHAATPLQPTMVAKEQMILAWRAW